MRKLYTCAYFILGLYIVMDNTVRWYVLRAVFRSEQKVRDALRRAGIRCYVPLCYRVDTIQGHKVRRLVPAITDLVFVHATVETISEFKLHSKDTVYWLTKPLANKHEKIVVPDKAMDDFIRITQQNEQTVTYFRPEEIQLDKGDRIRIHGGAFDGVEGVMMKVKGKRVKQLLVSIPDLAVAAVSVKPDVVEVVSQQRPASRDILGDAKELIRLATTMLTSPPDKETSRHEWDLLYREIVGLYESLMPRKGYIASTEAQLSLALLLAEHVMGCITESTLQRCCTAASRLRPSKLREQLFEVLKKNTP